MFMLITDKLLPQGERISFALSVKINFNKNLKGAISRLAPFFYAKNCNKNSINLLQKRSLKY